MHVDVRDIEAVGERGCESCGGVAGWAMVGEYVALGSEAGGAAAWESAAVEAAGCRVRYRYLH
jgi:hypothetical protein